jgi:PAS domain S-box-containing protein
MQCTIVPMLDANGRHVKSVAIRTDITESQRDKSARFLNDLLDHLQDEVYIFDIETLGMRYANLKAMSRCGWTDADLQTKRIVDANRNFKEDFFRAHVAPLFTGEKDVVNIEFTLKNVSFEISTRRYTGECGQELFVSILRDTTERKKLELAKLETVSIVSHELRTPLTSIKGALRLLNSGALGPVSEKAKQVLDIADRNSERLLLVVNDILDLEKIRAGKMEFDLVPSDLLTLAIDAVELNKGYGDEHGVKFEFHSEVLQARANMSTDRMMQVMSNLMSNAAKFSPPGATVSVNIHRHMDCWRIGVTDEGPGIPESARASVFESFKQLDNVDDDKRKGTGLGLTISQKIIQAHGGSIDFECSNQKGTTFFVDLPALENDKTYLAAHPGIAAE